MSRVYSTEKSERILSVVVAKREKCRLHLLLLRENSSLPPVYVSVARPPLPALKNTLLSCIIHARAQSPKKDFFTIVFWLPNVSLFAVAAATILVAVEVVDPGVPVGAGALAGGELPLVALVLEVALVLLAAAAGGAVGEVAAHHGGVDDGVEGLRVAHPVDELLAGDKVDVGEGQDGVEEVEEALAAVRAVVEPGGVEEEREGGLVLGVVLEEVLGEDLLDGGGILLVVASISHGAGASPHVLDNGHGDLPHTGVGQLGAGLDGAGVGHVVLQGVGPGGGAGGHAGVVVEAVAVEHVKHGVTADGQEGGAHALDVLGIDSGVADEHLGLADHLVGPLLLVEVGPVAVGDGVRGNLVAVGVEVLHLGVVGPLVGHVEGGLE